MLRERRKHKRLGICIIVEFKSSQSSKSSLGITRDVAGEGFSFESQDLDVEPGESLDFMFKNSESNVYVSVAGVIVWKKRNNEFGYLIGIRFNEIDDETRREVYEAISTTGHVPMTSLASGNGYDYEESYPEDHASMYCDSAQTDETIHGIPLTDVESGSQEPSLLKEQPVVDVEDGMNEDSTTGKEQDPLAHTFPVKTNRRKKKPLYEPVIKIIVLLLLLLAAILLFGEPDKMLESDPVHTKEPVIVKELEIKQHVQPVVYEAPPVLNVERPKAPYLVQVGAWKNPEYSNEILPRLQAYYPDAYIVVVNNFNIIRIPGVMHREQGGMMLMEIRDKFNLAGIVIANK
jgi:cell division septation protein DedD